MMNKQKYVCLLVVVVAILAIGIVYLQNSSKDTSVPMMRSIPPSDTSAQLGEGTDQMGGFPCHKMGGSWMGDCEFDASGNPTNL